MSGLSSVEKRGVPEITKAVAYAAADQYARAESAEDKANKKDSLMRAASRLSESELAQFSETKNLDLTKASVDRWVKASDAIQNSKALDAPDLPYQLVEVKAKAKADEKTLVRELTTSEQAELRLVTRGQPTREAEKVGEREQTELRVSPSGRGEFQVIVRQPTISEERANRFVKEEKKEEKIELSPSGKGSFSREDLALALLKRERDEAKTQWERMGAVGAELHADRTERARIEQMKQNDNAQIRAAGQRAEIEANSRAIPRDEQMKGLKNAQLAAALDKAISEPRSEQNANSAQAARAVENELRHRLQTGVDAVKEPRSPEDERAGARILESVKTRDKIRENERAEVMER